MQLLSSKSPARKIKKSKSPDHTAETEEKDWEGFGEEESEAHKDVSRSKDKVPMGKNTQNSEKKRRRQDEKQKKQRASQPKRSANTFEALGTADEGGDSVDDKEGDGKQEGRVKSFICL